MALCADSFLTGCSLSALFAYFVWTSSFPRASMQSDGRIGDKMLRSSSNLCKRSSWRLTYSPVLQAACYTIHLKSKPSSIQSLPTGIPLKQNAFHWKSWVWSPAAVPHQHRSITPWMQAARWRSEQVVRLSEAAQDLLHYSHAGGGPKKPADGLKAFKSIANPACSLSPWDVPIWSPPNHKSTQEPGQKADSNRARLPCWMGMLTKSKQQRPCTLPTPKQIRFKVLLLPLKQQGKADSKQPSPTISLSLVRRPRQPVFP